jgi:hypothetical protein
VTTSHLIVYVYSGSLGGHPPLTLTTGMQHIKFADLPVLEEHRHSDVARIDLGTRPAREVHRQPGLAGSGLLPDPSFQPQPSFQFGSTQIKRAKSPRQLCKEAKRAKSMTDAAQKR